MIADPLSIRVIGAGRAGGSFADALSGLGHDVELVHHDRAGDHSDADLHLLCVPDASVADTAATLDVDADSVVAHCAGSLGLDVLGSHPRVASLHPLVSLPDRHVGAPRLHGAAFAVAGDPLVEELVDQLGGRSFPVADDRRALYHAAAVVASNHLVALMGQVQRLAADSGVPLEAFGPLAAGSLDNALKMGPSAALTGPVARGDWATVQRHLDALPEAERDGYAAMVELAKRLVDEGGSAQDSADPRLT